MKPRLIEPHFETGTFSERCRSLFENDHDFERNPGVLTPELRQIRTIEWRHDNDAYLVEQYGSEELRYLRRKIIHHEMFKVAMSGMTRPLDNMREFKSWKIQLFGAEPENISFIDTVVHSSAEAEQRSGELRSNAQFARVHSLDAPNDEELAQLSDILASASTDGFNRFSKKLALRKIQ